jgi:hypothetical protein
MGYEDDCWLYTDEEIEQKERIKLLKSLRLNLERD